MDGKLASALIISNVVLKLDASMKMMRYDSLTAHYIKEEIMLQIAPAAMPITKYHLNFSQLNWDSKTFT